MRVKPNKELLSSKIRESGFRKEYIAQKLGMSLNSLNNKISGRTPFMIDEAYELKKLLNIESDDVELFFLHRS